MGAGLIHAERQIGSYTYSQRNVTKFISAFSDYAKCTILNKNVIIQCSHMYPITLLSVQQEKPLLSHTPKKKVFIISISKKSHHL